jgi:hypothetical protein
MKTWGVDYGWLTFGNERFRWEYNETLEIRPYHRKRNKIILTFDKQSLLQLINRRLHDETNAEIHHIPMEFLSKAIKKALEFGWNPKDAIAEMHLYFASNVFSQVKP